MGYGTDGRTDGRTDGVKLIYPQKLRCVGWDGWGKIALIWMSLDLTDDQSTLVQVMVWCSRATSHYPSQWWPRSLSWYRVTRPKWVECVILQPISMTDLLSASNEIGHRWKPQNFANDKSASVQVMADAVRQQAITWTNVEQALCLHMTSLEVGLPLFYMQSRYITC